MLRDGKRREGGETALWFGVMPDSVDVAMSVGGGGEKQNQ